MATNARDNREDQSGKADEDFIQEIKSHFDREVEARTTLDNKANTMITTSNAIITLAVGSGTFFVTIVQPKNDFYAISIIIPFLGITFAILSIVFFISSYTIKEYTYPMRHKPFFHDKGNGNYNQQAVDEFLNEYTKVQFKKHIAEMYLKSIKSHFIINRTKARSFRLGHYFFFGNILTVIVLIAYLLAISSIGLIEFK